MLASRTSILRQKLGVTSVSSSGYLTHKCSYRVSKAPSDPGHGPRSKSRACRSVDSRYVPLQYQLRHLRYSAVAVSTLHRQNLETPIHSRTPPVLWPLGLGRCADPPHRTTGRELI